MRNLLSNLFCFGPDFDGGGDSSEADVNSLVSADEFLSMKDAARQTMGDFGRNEKEIEEENEEDTGNSLPAGLVAPTGGGGAIPPQNGGKKDVQADGPENEVKAAEGATGKDGKSVETPGDSSKVLFRKWDQDFSAEAVEKVFDACKTYHETRAEFDAAIDKFNNESKIFEQTKASFESGPAYQMAKFLEDNPGEKAAMLAFIEKHSPEYAEKIKTSAKTQEVQTYEAKISELEKQLAEAQGTVEKTQKESRRASEVATAKQSEEYLQAKAQELRDKHDIKIPGRLIEGVKRAAIVALNTINPQTGKPNLTFDLPSLQKFFDDNLAEEVNELVSFRDEERTRHFDQKRKLPAPPPSKGGTVKHSPKPPTDWKAIQAETHRRLNEIFQPK